MYDTLSTKRLRALLGVLAIIGFSGIGAQAQEREEPETLIKGHIDNGFVFSFDDKLSTIDGNFANFAGIHTGWLINHRFLIALAGYGTTDASRGLDMGYGGVLVEYFFDPNKPIQLFGAWLDRGRRRGQSSPPPRARRPRFLRRRAGGPRHLERAAALPAGLRDRLSVGVRRSQRSRLERAHVQHLDQVREVLKEMTSEAKADAEVRHQWDRGHVLFSHERPPSVESDDGVDHERVVSVKQMRNSR